MTNASLFETVTYVQFLTDSAISYLFLAGVDLRKGVQKKLQKRLAKDFSHYCSESTEAGVRGQAMRRWFLDWCNARIKELPQVPDVADEVPDV